jgi:prepilin-type N-terminal cleavage/methylation domain-containing protein
VACAFEAASGDGARSPRPTQRRTAFTLIELLLVLGLVVIVSGVAYPALRGPLARRRLEAAANQLRAELAQVRLGAIQSGETQEFRYLPGSASFRHGPLEVLPAPAEFGQQEAQTGPRLTAGGGRAATIAMDVPRGIPRWEESSLEEPITFAPPDEAWRESAEQTAPDARFNEMADDLAGEVWSPPILFEPDGASTNASIRLLNDRGLQVVVTLNGLTGIATVGPVEAVPDQNSPVAELIPP